MQKGHVLHFNCQNCQKNVGFSLFELTKNSTIYCKSCKRTYFFGDPILLRQLDKFEKLCHQLVESEEILANTCVGIDVGEKQVKIPYRLLLTRLTSKLELSVGPEEVNIEFRFEPTKDFSHE